MAHKNSFLSQNSRAACSSALEHAPAGLVTGGFPAFAQLTPPISTDPDISASAVPRTLRGGQLGAMPATSLTRFGLADPNPERSASGEAAQRNLIAIALAADDARVIRDSAHASARQVRRAHQRLREAMRRAAANGGLVPVDGRDHRDVLVDYIAVLRRTSSLLDIDGSPRVHVLGQHAEECGRVHDELIPLSACSDEPLTLLFRRDLGKGLVGEGVPGDVAPCRLASSALLASARGIFGAPFPTVEWAMIQNAVWNVFQVIW